MTADEREAVARFRYGVIAPMVARKLEPKEQAQLIREAAQRHYAIPGSTSTTVHRRTIERWLTAYRQGGWEALKPKDRKDAGRVKAVNPETLDLAVALKREEPARSVEQIIRMLELAGEVPPGALKRITLGRHLRRVGATRQELLKPRKAWRRFTAPHRNAIWQGDCQHTLYLPDPGRPGRKRQAYLIAFLDDYSRLVPHAQCYFEERRPKLEDCLKKAISRCGLPETLYVDNGSIYSSAHLARIGGELAMRIIHSRPYKPQGRGKIEKFFQFVDKSFVPEAYILINSGKIATLEQFNEFFWAWLEVGYHQRKHASTKQAPRIRYAADKHEPRRVAPERLREVFLWREERKVDKTGCVRILGNSYEVSEQLLGRKVELRYDPYDLSQVHVFHDGKRYPDAHPTTLNKGASSLCPRT